MLLVLPSERRKKEKKEENSNEDKNERKQIRSCGRNKVVARGRG